MSTCCRDSAICAFSSDLNRQACFINIGFQCREGCGAGKKCCAGRCIDSSRVCCATNSAFEPSFVDCPTGSMCCGGSNGEFPNDNDNSRVDCVNAGATCTYYGTDFRPKHLFCSGEKPKYCGNSPNLASDDKAFCIEKDRECCNFGVSTCDKVNPTCCHGEDALGKNVNWCCEKGKACGTAGNQCL